MLTIEVARRDAIGRDQDEANVPAVDSIIMIETSRGSVTAPAKTRAVSTSRSKLIGQGAIL